MPVCASPRRLSEALVTNLDLLPEPGDDGIRGMKGAQNAPRGGAAAPPLSLAEGLGSGGQRHRSALVDSCFD